MKTELEIVLLEAAKGYLKSLSNEDFLALTCDIFALIVGLVRLVRNESAARNINPTDNTAKTFTWEQNTNPAVTSDPNHAIYLQQLALQEQINAQLRDMRADVKRTAEKLEKAHPESESIKRGFRLAFLQA